MTIDVEDYFHVSVFEKTVDRSRWDSLESRVRANTARLLDLFDEHGVRGTFFVLGWVAERYPELVRTIAERGHELASHGYAHRLVYDQTPEAFREDIRRAKDLIESAAAQPVRGYRAPSFSVTARSMWALDVLLEEGYTYDASIFPIRHDRYGIPDAPRWPHTIERGRGRIFEVPGSTVRIGSTNLPVAGGGYFRILPYAWTRWGIARVNAAERQPAIFYLHPWEIDPRPAAPAGGMAGPVPPLPQSPGGRAAPAPAARRLQLRPPAARPPRVRVTPTPMRVLADHDPDVCDAYVRSHPRATPYHLRAWLGVIERAFGHRALSLAAEADGRIAGVLPLAFFDSRVFGRFAVSLPFVNYGGVLADTPEAEQALLARAVDEATKAGCAHLELRHCDQHFPALAAKRHKVAMMLRLTDSVERQWNELDRKVRNQVRKGEKSQLSIDVGGSELLPAFYAVFARNMRDLGTPVYSAMFLPGGLWRVSGTGPRLRRPRQRPGRGRIDRPLARLDDSGAMGVRPA